MQLGECLLYTLTGLCSDGQRLLTRTKAWFVPAVLLLDTECFPRVACSESLAESSLKK